MAWPLTPPHPSCVSFLLIVLFYASLLPRSAEGAAAVSSSQQRRNVKPPPPPPPPPPTPPRRAVPPYAKPVRVVMHSEEFALGDRMLNEFPVWHAPIPTVSQVWPKPLFEDRKARIFHLNNATLKFKFAQVTSDVLSRAVARTHLIISERAVSVAPPSEAQYNPTSTTRLLDRVTLTVYKKGENWPHLGMDESYRLEVDPNEIHLWASEQWGAIRALETLTHLIWQNKDGKLFINEVTIRDKPAFPHRGMLVDTARHYLSKSIILKNLEAMAANKLNVMHWHIVDDQSFPYQSIVYPELSKKGAYDPDEKVYSQQDIKEIITYARSLGIRVIPEFDSPAHSFSWGKGYPHLLTECFVNGQSDGFYGPLDVNKESTFKFIKNLFNEVTRLFPDNFLHLGVDEVGNSCWLSNPDIQQMMTRLKLSSGSQLSKYYVEKLQSILLELQKETKKSIKTIVWQEGGTVGAKFNPDTLVQLWTANIMDLGSIANSGQKVLYSSCWYLDNLKHWTAAYSCDLGDTHATWRKNFLGGETCMWAEKVSDETMLQKSWPVASAAAERLWSKHIDSLEGAGGRIEEQRCRLIQRGIPTGVPSGPGSCPAVRNANRRGGPAIADKLNVDFFSTPSSCSWIQFIIVIATLIFFIVLLIRRSLHVGVLRSARHLLPRCRQSLPACAKWTLVIALMLALTFLLV